MLLLGGTILALSVPAPHPQAQDAEHPPVPERCEVVKVVDGDTIHVRRGGTIEKLRLLSVDTEEKISGQPNTSPTKPATVFGQETMLWAQELFAGLATDGTPARVELRFPDGEEARDVYGRLLCHVLLPDGTDFNLRLVREGWSPYFVKYGYSRICHEAFRAAEEEARAAKRGIWNPATNRARTKGAPEVRRPYDRLRPWWEARARAIEEFRARRAKDPAHLVDAEDPAGLQRALELCRAQPDEEVEVFGSIERFFEEENGDRTVLFRSSHPGDALRVHLPADARVRFAALDLDGTTAEFRQNFLYVHGVVTRGPRGFSLTSTDPAAWRYAAPSVAHHP